MADAIRLSPEEQALYDALQALVSESHSYYENRSSDYKEQEERNKEMAEKAHELHMKLKEEEHEPKHHAYMLKNRGVPVEDPEFYQHLHPVEDLLAFIDDPDANNDPEDTTLGVEFKTRIYTNRWGHYDTYFFKRIETGWEIRSVSAFQNINADKQGKPALFRALKHESVNYPHQTGELLEAIWDKAARGATKEEVLRYINELAEWISVCERSTPDVWYED